MSENEEKSTGTEKSKRFAAAVLKYREAQHEFIMLLIPEQPLEETVAQVLLQGLCNAGYAKWFRKLCTEEQLAVFAAKTNTFTTQAVDLLLAVHADPGDLK